jgi:hypothetical protein
MSRAKRIGLVLLGFGLSLLGCQLLEPTAPQASTEVLDAIYAGMKRAQEHSGGAPVEPAPPDRPS